MNYLIKKKNLNHIKYFTKFLGGPIPISSLIPIYHLLLISNL